MYDFEDSLRLQSTHLYPCSEALLNGKKLIEYFGLWRMYLDPFRLLDP